MRVNPLTRVEDTRESGDPLTVPDVAPLGDSCCSRVTVEVRVARVNIGLSRFVMHAPARHARPRLATHRALWQRARDGGSGVAGGTNQRAVSAKRSSVQASLELETKTWHACAGPFRMRVGQAGPCWPPRKPGRGRESPHRAKCRSRCSPAGASILVQAMHAGHAQPLSKPSMGSRASGIERRAASDVPISHASPALGKQTRPEMKKRQ